LRARFDRRGTQLSMSTAYSHVCLALQEVEALVERAQRVRAVAATCINDRSSRSHTLLTAWLTTSGHRGSFRSKLNLVDLAGSERRAAVDGKGAAAACESSAINKSLLSLQNVVAALSQAGAAPAFRASKLTHLLRDSLGGNCVTTLAACAWGDPAKLHETLATCRCALNTMLCLLVIWSC
jgi:kinesin family member 6/9